MLVSRLVWGRGGATPACGVRMFVCVEVHDGVDSYAGLNFTRLNVRVIQMFVAHVALHHGGILSFAARSFCLSALAVAADLHTLYRCCLTNLILILLRAFALAT